MAWAVLLRIATGQRSEEILRITVDSYDRAKGMIYWAETKNGLPHCIPLPRQSAEVLAGLPANSHGLFFPRQDDPTRPASQQSIREVVRTFLGEHPDFAHFAPKDLRRTFKTLGGAAGISKEMRDRLQNHAEAGVSARHYDRWSYWPEKKAAMATWEAHLDRVIAGTVADDSNVVPMRREVAA
jgi:integrase